MSNDRSWINRRCVAGQLGFTREFLKGIEEFINFAERNSKEPNKMIRCPCCRCRNTAFKNVDDVRYDILANGFNPSYTLWTLHGEAVRESYSTCSKNVNVMEDRDDVFDPYEMLRDAGGYSGWNNEDTDVNDSEPNDEASKFYNLVNDAGVPIYPGNTKYTKLSFVTKLLHFKSTHGCSEKGFNELLSLIGDVLPEEHKLPSSYYEIKKMVKELNLGYQKIHVCENDCMLFYGDDINRQECKYCGTSRYKEATESGNHSIPKKVLRYFPLTPRLQRLYMSSRTAESMRWHNTRVVQEGILTHPADGEEWKQFDINFPDFAKDVRNVRLGLATDGFSPYNDKSSRMYSVWPVIIVVYNLPPSMCMKDPYMFMTLLIPGEKSPTRDINVYLRPLIDELRQLWDVGVQTYDAFKRSNFTLRAALFWTINDYPGLAMVSGWSTKGKLSCSVCMGYVKALHLKYSRKSSYWGTSHQFRKPRRCRQLGIQIRKKCERIVFPPPGKLSLKSRADGFGVTHNWTHLPIFFDLPYWDSLSLRHCIDVMHTEKNVFDNVFHTVLDTNKSKDNNKSRADLKELGIREDLWIRGTSKTKASFVLSREQQIQFYTWVSELRMPDGCASNIARCSNVKMKKLSGMKSHDCHVFMQKLLPSAFRGLLPDDVHNALCNLSNYFKGLCSSALVLDDLVIMEKNIVKIMCTLENIFPPSFFDSMEHLPIHLAEECRLGGPVQYRWMYPFERQMRLMKLKVGNKARVEGSIAERYTEEELVHFCSLYFDSSVQTVHNRLGRNIVDVASRDPSKLEAFTYPTRLFGKSQGYFLDEATLKIASDYVFSNMPELIPYRVNFEAEVRAQNPLMSIDQMNDQFKEWLIEKMQHERDTHERFSSLLGGPSPYVISFRGCEVNGYKFKCSKSHRGVLVKGSCNNGTIDNYYGRLEEIIRLLYSGGNQVVLFKCHWFDNKRGIKVDNNQIVTIDMTSKLRGNDVFVLASQATQVYYAPSVKNLQSKFHTVITTKSRPLDESQSQAQSNDEALQEEPLEVRPSELPAINLFVDLSNYQNDMIMEVDENDDENEDEDEEEEENEESENDEDDGFDEIE